MEQGKITNLDPLCYKPLLSSYEGNHIDCDGIIPVGDLMLNEKVIIIHVGEWRYAIRTGGIIDG